MNQYRTISEKLADAHRAINNGLNDPEIAAALEPYGYDATKLGDGIVLWEAADALFHRQELKYGDQFAATDALDAARNIAEADYNVHLAVARVVFRDDHSAEHKLRLRGRRKKALDDWMAQSMGFYLNALAEQPILDRLADFGIAQTDLEAARDKVIAIYPADAFQEDRKGGAQQSTKNRDKAIDALEEWMEDYLDIARIALIDQPQLLEALGIHVPS